MEVKIKILSFFIFISFFYIEAELFAQSNIANQSQVGDAKTNRQQKNRASKKKKKDSGQSAHVKIDGAAIYEAPNFDSPVLEYMDAEKKVVISKKIYTGIGGLGAFYKVKLRQNIYGYIADTDVEIKIRDGNRDSDNDDRDNGADSEIQGDAKKSDESEGDPTVLRDFKSRDEDEPAFTNSIYMTRYLGVVYSSYNYTEVLRKTTETSQVGMIGAKLTGPTGLMGGIPMDVGLVLTTSAPNFYSEIATSTKGYMLIGDGLFIMPLYESSSLMAFFGLGLMLRYSAWQVSLKSQSGKPAIDSQEIGFGAAAEAGTAVRLWKNTLLRLDGKYYYETEKYFGFDLAVQFKY